MIKTIFIALSLCLAAPLRAEEGVERTLTLPQSVQIALQNNHDLLSAREDIRIAEQRVNEARSQYYPKVGLNLNTSRYLAQQNYVVPPEFGSTLLAPSRNLRPDMFYSARVWAQQSIYNGGRTQGDALLSETNLAQAHVQYDEIHAQVVYEVFHSFYDVLLAGREVQLLEETAKDVDALASQAPAGDAVQQVGLQAVQSRIRRALAEKGLEKRKLYLHYLNALGLELYTQVGVDGKLEMKNADLDLAKLLAWAQESRLEIRSVEYQKEIDRLSVNLSEAERYPVVSLGAGYELNDREFPLQNTQWNTTLNVSLPIFDGFSSRSRIRQRKSQANQSRIRRAEIEDRINIEVRQGYADFAYWKEEAARRQDELQKLEQSAARLESGKNALERAQAREWLMEANQAYWQAVHGYRVALAKLEKAIGRPLVE